MGKIPKSHSTIQLVLIPPLKPFIGMGLKTSSYGQVKTIQRFKIGTPPIVTNKKVETETTIKNEAFSEKPYEQEQLNFYNMKKLMTIFGAMIFASFILTSCGGESIEGDAKKVAELQCKAQQLMQKATNGDISVMEESTKLSSEAETLTKEMKEKYTSDSDKEKFAEALLKEMGNCK